MKIIALIRFVLMIYFLMQLLHFSLPYVTAAQQPWMSTLARLCEPGVRIGNQVASKILPDRRFKIDIGSLAAAAICYILQAILSIF
ncbi:MAG: YggT family protein [Clostridia bacterium]|nr:YggT family protein [Clostridia bacterium]